MIGALVTCLTVLIGVRLNTHFEKEKKNAKKGKKNKFFMWVLFIRNTIYNWSIFRNLLFNFISIYDNRFNVWDNLFKYL